MAVKGNCLVPEGRLNKLLQKKLLLPLKEKAMPLNGLEESL